VNLDPHDTVRLRIAWVGSFLLASGVLFFVSFVPGCIAYEEGSNALAEPWFILAPPALALTLAGCAAIFLSPRGQGNIAVVFIAALALMAFCAAGIQTTAGIGAA
jgi:hypothetical protein